MARIEAHKLRRWTDPTRISAQPATMAYRAHLSSSRYWENAAALQRIGAEPGYYFYSGKGLDGLSWQSLRLQRMQGGGRDLKDRRPAELVKDQRTYVPAFDGGRMRDPLWNLANQRHRGAMLLHNTLEGFEREDGMGRILTDVLLGIHANEVEHFSEDSLESTTQMIRAVANDLQGRMNLDQINARQYREELRNLFPFAWFHLSKDFYTALTEDPQFAPVVQYRDFSADAVEMRERFSCLPGPLSEPIHQFHRDLGIPQISLHSKDSLLKEWADTILRCGLPPLAMVIGKDFSLSWQSSSVLNARTAEVLQGTTLPLTVSQVKEAIEGIFLFRNQEVCFVFASNWRNCAKTYLLPGVLRSFDHFNITDRIVRALFSDMQQNHLDFLGDGHNHPGEKELEVSPADIIERHLCGGFGLVINVPFGNYEVFRTDQQGAKIGCKLEILSDEFNPLPDPAESVFAAIFAESRHAASMQTREIRRQRKLVV